MKCRAAALLLLAIAGAGCTIFPAARDVTIQGHLRTDDGNPVAGAVVGFVVLKNRPFAMPGVGEHGKVMTDVDGRYLLELKRVYDAVDIWTIDSACAKSEPFHASILKASFSRGRPVVQDFICLRDGR
jgi:hypothetical protein